MIGGVYLCYEGFEKLVHKFLHGPAQDDAHHAELNAPFATRVAVLVGIALAMTAGVYGLVAGIVKLDDAGRYLAERDGDAVVARIQRRIGASILQIAPWLMKILSIAGTAAMFLVGGGILVHGIPGLHGWIEGLPKDAAVGPGIGGMFRLAMSLLLDAVMGFVAGALALAAARGAQRVLHR